MLNQLLIFTLFAVLSVQNKGLKIDLLANRKVITTKKIIRTDEGKEIKFGPCTYSYGSVSSCEDRTYTLFKTYNLSKGDSRICPLIKIKDTLCKAGSCHYKVKARSDCDGRFNVRFVTYELKDKFIKGLKCPLTTLIRQWCKKCLYIPGNWSRCDPKNKTRQRRYTLMKGSSANICEPKVKVIKCNQKR